jgi:hypothetical protein
VVEACAHSHKREVVKMVKSTSSNHTYKNCDRPSVPDIEIERHCMAHSSRSPCGEMNLGCRLDEKG